MRKLYIPILIAIILSLVSTVYFGFCKELDTKANNDTIMVYIEKQEKQQDKDRQERKEDKREQQKINDRMMQSIQMLLIKMVDSK